MYKYRKKLDKLKEALFKEVYLSFPHGSEMLINSI